VSWDGEVERVVSGGRRSVLGEGVWDLLAGMWGDVLLAEDYVWLTSCKTLWHFLYAHPFEIEIE